MISGDPFGMHRLDRVRRVNQNGGQEHREGRFRNRAYAQGHADKRAQISHRNHADLWTVEDQIHWRVYVM